MKELIWGLLELVFPKFCIICYKSGDEICLECGSYWVAKPYKINLGETKLYFVKDYDSQAAKVTLLAKENHNKEAINLISFSIFLSIKALINESKLSGTINIVTIPSSSKTIMKRGRDNISDICNKVIKLLRKDGINANNTPVLTQVRRVRDQSKLNRVERIRNLDYAYRLKNKQLDGNSCILMDDLITTGSSLSEAIRALTEAKITILGAVTACAVGRKSLIR
ncbi:MAG: ComF family protein [Actinobacteria bacterium]|nr:ComF family protein [Actinomycetota bacterium]